MRGILTARLGKRMVKVNPDSARLNDEGKLIISVKHEEKNGKGKGFFQIDASELKNQPGADPIKETIVMLHREKLAKQNKKPAITPNKKTSHRGEEVYCRRQNPGLSMTK